MRSNLREWLNRAIMLKNKQNAKTIQRYIRTNILLEIWTSLQKVWKL